VLQENIIIMLERGGAQGGVTASTSTDDSFADLTHQTHPFNRIVFADDPGRFIHVPTSHARNSIDLSPLIRCTLDDLGLKVSTGPVVDFRVRKHVRDMPGPGTVVEESSFSGVAALGFENHLNVFHQHKQGLPVALARGRAVFLNTTAIDEQFRRFNGHTQVNATDLRQMKYRRRVALLALGKWAAHRKSMTQAEIGHKLEKLTA
jgi:hypothetical protein